MNITPRYAQMPLCVIKPAFRLLHEHLPGFIAKAAMHRT